ncbi:DUF1365 domain-containing protein [Candidatus Falkowbacteria bacterium]|nr:DUF1365 domain-containing protein [Candidatus Falkowbacteria bacterium]
MNSCIYVSKLFHERLKPRKNAFRYSIYMMYLDLDELVELDKKYFTFGYNRKNILSFYDVDHFKFLYASTSDSQTIARENVSFDPAKYINKNTKERIQIFAQELGFEFEIDKVFVLTNLRNFGYVFNPVTFYYCFDKSGTFRVLFNEVNNTFLDQKMYYILIDDAKQQEFTSKQKKNYYISPFIDYANDLEWHFDIPSKSFRMAIDSLKDEEVTLKTFLTGRRVEVTNSRLLWVQLRYPLMAIRIIILIHYQALKLFIKKVSYFKKAETDAEIAQVINNKTITK